MVNEDRKRVIDYVFLGGTKGKYFVSESFAYGSIVYQIEGVVEKTSPKGNPAVEFMIHYPGVLARESKSLPWIYKDFEASKEQVKDARARDNKLAKMLRTTPEQVSSA